MNWIILVLIATSLWAIMGIIHKFVRVEYIEDSIGYLIFIVPTVLFTLVLLLFQPFTLLKGTQAFLAILSGVFTMIGCYFYIEALHKEEVSRVFILSRISPIIVLILSTIFLNEILTMRQYLAFALIFIGTILISFKKVEDKIKLSIGALLVLMSSLFWSTQTVILKYISEINLATTMIHREAGYLIAIIVIFLFSSKARSSTKKIIKDLNIKKTIIVYSAEIMGMTGMFLVYLAIQQGPVSLVQVAEGFEAVFVLILAVIISKFFPKILKEKFDIKTISIKIISIVLMLGGLFMIVT
jgi:drug/metabolite transporter (DMT)-like permease